MDKFPTIYIVTAGSYSEYHIVGVYSTQENAELAASITGDDPDRIEEYTLDGDIDHLARGEMLFTVYMWRNGKTRLFGPTRVGEETTTLRPYNNNPQNQHVLILCRWADRVESVVKIANEHRTRMIASGKWPPS